MTPVRSTQLIRRAAVVAVVALALAGCGTSSQIGSKKLKASTTSTSADETTTTTEDTTTSEDTTTTTEAPTTTTPPFGTRAMPIPLGIEVPAGDWKITVLGYEPNVDSLVAATNQFNDKAPAGSQYVRLKLRAVYDGTGTGSPGTLSINLVGKSAATYDHALVAGGSGDPQALSDQAETFKGGAVTGFIYYLLPTADALGKVLGFPPNVTYSDVPGGVGFFAVN